MPAELTLRFMAFEKHIMGESAIRSGAWEWCSKAGVKGRQRALPPEQRSGSTKLGEITHKTFAFPFQLKTVIYSRAAMVSSSQIKTLCIRQKPTTRLCSKEA